MRTIGRPRGAVEFALALVGPAGGGKSELLKHLFSRLQRGARGGLVSIGGKDGGTVFCDFLLLDVGAVAGQEVLGELYAAPGRDRYWLAERMILQHADGVLFVADASGHDGGGNQRAWRRLQRGLAPRGGIAGFPLVVLANKRDRAGRGDPLPLEAETRELGVPVLTSSATTGEGVLEALKRVTAVTLRDLASRGARRPPPEASPLAGEPEAAADVRKASELYLRTFSALTTVYSPHSDRYLAEVCTRLKLLDEERMADALSVQRASEGAGLGLRLDEVLERRGLLKPEDLRTARQLQAHGEVVHEEILYGKIAIESGFTDFARVKDAIATQRARDFGVALGPLLLAGGAISRRQHREILSSLAAAHERELLRDREMPAAEKDGTTQFIKAFGRQRKTGALFGNLAVRLGYVSPEQLDECLAEQRTRRRDGVDAFLGVIMQEKGYVTDRQVEIVCQSLQGELVKNPIENYKVEAELGRGAMGLVYAARQLNLDRIVALKVLDPRLAMDQSFIERFLKEARAAAALNHPNIVAAYDVGRSRGYYYFAMEYVEGLTVKQLIEERGKLTPLEAVDIALQVLRALAHAESGGLVHRDVKPANIMMTPEKVAKLCDLGLAARAGDAEGKGKIVGSPFYIAPEQIEGREDVDSRADVYALGATLYHMLTGQPPYPGETAEEIFLKHLTARTPDPSDAVPEIPRIVGPVTRKMMEKDRNDRYGSAADALTAMKALRRTLEGGGRESEGIGRTITRKIKTMILRREE